MTKTEELLKLIKENPDLPIVPMVDGEVVGDDCYRYWLGIFEGSKIEEIYTGREYTHIKDEDDEEDVLNDLVGCKYGCDPQGRDIYDDLSDDEWKALYESIPWTKCIVVYIGI